MQVPSIEPSKLLHVSNISPNVSEEDIRAIFDVHGAWHGMAWKGGSSGRRGRECEPEERRRSDERGTGICKRAVLLLEKSPRRHAHQVARGPFSHIRAELQGR